MRICCGSSVCIHSSREAEGRTERQTDSSSPREVCRPEGCHTWTVRDTARHRGPPLEVTTEVRWRRSHSSGAFLSRSVFVCCLQGCQGEVVNCKAGRILVLCHDCGRRPFRGPLEGMQKGPESHRVRLGPLRGSSPGWSPVHSLNHPMWRQGDSNP